MPWSTPTLSSVRSLVRDMIRGSLPGADATIPNSVLRVLSDSQGALCHLTLQYVDWLSLQLLPDTAEAEWLDRHANIWLVNADGTTGRKLATLATGTGNFTGFAGTVIPLATQLISGTSQFGYETTAEITLASDNEPTAAPIRALDPGSGPNLLTGTFLTMVTPIDGVDEGVIVGDPPLQGGTDEETDDELRARVLARIRQPPMGGDQKDYQQWALAVPGVTRAWAAQEMGIGTVTIRFMMDDLRASLGGFPTAYDVQQVSAYLETVRPVTAKDYFVVAPIPRRVDVYIQNLDPISDSMKAAVQSSLQQMLVDRAAPGQTIYAAWKYQAIMNTAGVESFDLRYSTDDLMPSPGHMGVLGDVYYEHVASPAA